MKNIIKITLFSLIIYGCSNDDSGTPVADDNFNFDIETSSRSVNQGDTVYFECLSSNIPTDYQWKFGDGDSSDYSNPNHTYKNTGVYTISLTVIYENNEYTVTKELYIEVMSPQCYTSSFVQDIDGNCYQTKIFGDQEWMIENLKTTRYADGTNLLEVEDNETWNKLKKGDKAYCINQNDIRKDLGAFYTWHAVTNNMSSSSSPSAIKGICPTGWHVPSILEWEELIVFLVQEGYNFDGSYDSGTDNKLAKALSSTTGWEISNSEGSPGNKQELNNSSRFNAFPMSWRKSSGEYAEIGLYATFWTTYTSYWYYESEKMAPTMNIDCSTNSIYIYDSTTVCGYPIRCVKD